MAFAHTVMWKCVKAHHFSERGVIAHQKYIPHTYLGLYILMLQTSYLLTLLFTGRTNIYPFD